MAAPATSQTPITQPSPARSLQSFYEECFIRAIEGQNALRMWMQIRVGMSREPFLLFYDGFITLFDASKGVKGIEDKKVELIEKIENWAKPGPLNDVRFVTGMRLLDEWKQVVFEHKLIVPARVG